MGIQEIIYLIAGLGIGAVTLKLLGGDKLPKAPDSKASIIKFLTDKIDKIRKEDNTRGNRDEKSVEDYHNNSDS